MSLLISSGYIDRIGIGRLTYYQSCIDEISWKALGNCAKKLNLNCLQYSRFHNTVIFNYGQCYKTIREELAVLKSTSIEAEIMCTVNNLEEIVKKFLDQKIHSFLIFEFDTQK